LRQLRDIILKIRSRRDWLIALILINFGGSLYGFYWYRVQLAATPYRFWLFVPDCPLATLLFTVALILICLGREVVPFTVLTLFGLVKYGFWTVFVLGLYWGTGGRLVFTDFALFVSHLWMVAEALVFIPSTIRQIGHAGIAFAWFLLNDYMDYGLGLYPTLPKPEFLPLIRAVSLLSTLLLTIGFRWVARRPTGSGV
jgi:uncharacterized membrane protein YpjA